MHSSNLLIANAKKSIQLLLTNAVNLQLKNNISKLKEILQLQHFAPSNTQQDERKQTPLLFCERLSLISQVNPVRDSNSISNELPQKNMQQKQINLGEEQPNLNTIEQAIENLTLLLSTAQQYIFPNKENSEPTKPFDNNLSLSFSFQQIQQLLTKVIQDLKLIIRDANKSSFHSSNSQCHTHPNGGSNPSSIRSLLTEKLRQITSQDFDDPQYKNDRIVLQGNLMRQLNRASKPIIVSRRFEDLSEPFSMQNKHFNQNGPKILNKHPERVRVHSQRTILGEINLSSSHAHQKKQKKNEVGCSRCQIF